jgi:hypothetical protein
MALWKHHKPVQMGLGLSELPSEFDLCEIFCSYFISQTASLGSHLAVSIQGIHEDDGPY